MLDNLKLQFNAGVPSIALTESGPFDYLGLRFVPYYHKALGCIQFFDAKLDNLIVRLDPIRNRILIMNSLQKFFMGNNHMDFTLSQVQDAEKALSDRLHLDVGRGVIKQLEYAVNIAVPEKRLLLLGLQSYKGKPFHAMMHHGKKYGLRCDLAHHTLKGYDKTFEVKAHDKVAIEPSLFRWEMQVKNMQHLHKRKLPIGTLNDCLTHDGFQLLCHDLTQKFKATLKVDSIPTRNLILRERTAVARMIHPTIAEDVKQQQPATYKKDRYLYRKICLANHPPYMEKVSKLMAEKCAALLYG